MEQEPIRYDDHLSTTDHESRRLSLAQPFNLARRLNLFEENIVSTNDQISVRFARRPTRGMLLGFSAPRVAVLGLAGAIAVGSLSLAGAGGLMVSALAWAPLVAAAFVRVAGRPVIEWAGTATHFGLRHAAGQVEFRARPTRPRPAGTLALPGDGASMRLHTDQATGAAMIHDPHRHTLSVVVVVSHPAFALLDDADRAARVARWGRVLAHLAASGATATLQVLEASVPDPARGQQQWWEAHGNHQGGWAASQYEGLLDQVCLDSSRHRSTITLSLDMHAAARAIRSAGRGVGGRSLAGAAEVLRGDMAVLVEALAQAGLRPGSWLGEAELAAIVRQAFDPASSIDPKVDPGANLAHAGPLAVAESWDRLHHDSGWSQVLWISEWPRIAVPPDFLHSLVFAPGVRRSLCLLYRPLPTDKALRQLRREKTEAISDSAQKARIGQIADLSDAAEYEDLISRERSIIAGHTDVAFSGLVTVSAPSSEALDAASATITRAAGQAACEVRPLYGRQLAGFICSALPLGRSTL